MIDVKTTILETIKDKINQMRFLGKTQPLSLKKVLYLIVLDDIYDWSSYLDQPQAIQHKLQELRTQFILNNSDFIIKMFPNNNFYVNVNTPQTNDTWKRVWDAPDVIKISQLFQPFVPGDVHREPFIPDNTCPVSLTYFGQNEVIPADNEGKPLVDFATLTICEKMNIYINRETGKMFFLDPQDCVWKEAKSQGILSSDIKIEWENIIDHPTIYEGISHNLTDAKKVKVELLETGQPVNEGIDLATEEEIGGLL